MTGRPRRLAAPWVWPGEGAPIAGGAVLIDSAGRIAAVGPESAVPSAPGVVTERLNGVLVPGLINVHTHLELTGLDGRCVADSFPGWIRQLISLKAARSPAEVLAAAKQGIRDCWAAGVTTVADTGDSGAVIEALAELGGSGIAYHEVFGPDPAQADSALAAWLLRLNELSRFTGPRVRLGASPHAPYSVSGPLYQAAARHARAAGLPIAVHIAESEDESLLLEAAKGGFADAWRRRGIPLPEMPGMSPLKGLDCHGVLGPDTLCIHVVRPGNAGLDLLARRGSAVAHCPRSNRAHGHGDAPLAGFLERGLRVGVGTDSVASVAPLDLLAEARAARELAGLSAEATLHLVTLGAAQALRLEDEVGSLTPGKWGDLVALRLPGPVDSARLADTILMRLHEDVELTVLAGRTVWRDGVWSPEELPASGEARAGSR